MIPSESSPAPLTDAVVGDLRRRIRGAIARACPRWLADCAEDITQNAMVQLLARIDRSGGNREFTSIYLSKMAHGLVVDEIRRRSRRREESLETDLERTPHAADAADPESAATAREIGRGIIDCLGRLAPPRRLVVTLWLRGAGAAGTARRLGWTAKKVEHLLSRGRQDLRECLKRKGLRS